MLNLADNSLVGNLPSDLRFAPLEYLDVSGNKLMGDVPTMLCQAGDINGNGRDGIFQCDVIACSEGTYSPSGFAEGIEGLAFRACLPCRTNTYIATKYCNSGFSISKVMDSETVGSSNGYVLVIIIVISALCMSFLCQPVVSKKHHERLRRNDNKADEGSDIGGSEKAVHAFNLDKSKNTYSLKVSTQSRLGDASGAHPLSFIDIPSKTSSGPASAPLVWGRQREVELSDDWLSLT